MCGLHCWQLTTVFDLPRLRNPGVDLEVPFQFRSSDTDDAMDVVTASPVAMPVPLAVGTAAAPGPLPNQIEFSVWLCYRKLMKCHCCGKV